MTIVHSVLCLRFIYLKLLGEAKQAKGFCSRSRYNRRAMREGNDDHLLRLLKEFVIYGIKETDS